MLVIRNYRFKNVTLNICLRQGNSSSSCLSKRLWISSFYIRVVGGLDILTNIEAIETDTQDRPKVCCY